MILKVKRNDLIAAITAKAKANQQAYDDNVAEAANNDLGKAIDAAIDKAFGKDAPDNNVYPPTGYRKSDAKASKQSLLLYLGLNGTLILSKPLLYVKELAALSLAQDDVLDIEDTHPYFTAAS